MSNNVGFIFKKKTTTPVSRRTVKTVINRILPNADERDDAEYAASKKLVTTRAVKRNSSFKMIGIRHDYDIGEWVINVNKVNSPTWTGDDLTGTYPINAPIENITFDYENQYTAIGGLITEF